MQIDPNKISVRSKSDIQRALRVLARNIKVDRYTQVRSRVVSAFDGVVYLRGTITAHKHSLDQQNYGLYRARKLMAGQSPAQVFPSMEDIWCPEKPKHMKLLDWGRANAPRCPILYCSESEVCALSEMRPSVDDEFIVGHFVHTSDMPLKELTFVLLGAMDENEIRASRTAEDKRKPPPSLSAALLTPDDAEKNHLIHQFVREKFAEVIEKSEHEKYVLTAAIADYFMGIDQPVPIDAIMYPSVTQQMDMINFAIRPERARLHLKLEKAYHVQVTGIDGLIPQSKVLAQSASVGADGTIYWH